MQRRWQSGLERSFSEVWIKRNYRLCDGGTVMRLLLR